MIQNLVLPCSHCHRNINTCESNHVFSNQRVCTNCSCKSCGNPYEIGYFAHGYFFCMNYTCNDLKILLPSYERMKNNLRILNKSSSVYMQKLSKNLPKKFLDISNQGLLVKNYLQEQAENEIFMFISWLLSL